MKEFLKNKLSTLYFFYTYTGKKLYIMFAFSILMVVMDSVGLALFVPLLQIADQPESINESSNTLSVALKKSFQTFDITISIEYMVILIIVIFILKGLFFYFATKYNALAQQEVMLKMRSRLATSVMGLTYKEFVTSDVGRLQNSLLAEVWQVINGCIQYLEAIKNMLFVTIYLGFAFFMDWRFSIFVMIGGVLTNWIYKYFYVRTQSLSRKITKNNHRYGGILVEVITHFKYLKATGRDREFYERLQHELENLVKNNISVAKLSAKLSALREPMTIAVICSVIILHVSVFKAPLTGVIIILLFFYRVMQKIIDIQNNWNSYLSQTGAIENIIDFQAYLDKNQESFYIGHRKVNEINKIQLHGLDVIYGDYLVLNNIDLTIERNKSIAFVGESGSGKTTLVNLICNLLSYDSGKFILNGHDIREFDVNSYKSRIGYIGQEATVFNATLYDNITFWADKTPQNLHKFNNVIAMCSLSSFVNNLPEKECTLLGNNGVNVSGGQRQRISIARELFRDVELFIMDEATSALDSETENDIKKSIEELQGKVTIISIAHRLSTIKNADCIYILDKGQIVCKGDFEDLKGRSDYFRRLTELQGV